MAGGLQNGGNTYTSEEVLFESRIRNQKLLMHKPVQALLLVWLIPTRYCRQFFVNPYYFFQFPDPHPSLMVQDANWG